MAAELTRRFDKKLLFGRYRHMRAETGLKERFHDREHGRTTAETTRTVSKSLRWVLSWMPDVNVLAPKSLRDRIAEKLRDGLQAQE